MAKTLLQAVNEVLKRVGFIAGDAGELSSLTDSARQVAIDVAVQVINEAISDLYSSTGKPMPLEQAESTLTLVAAQRSYVLVSGLVQIRWPLIDRVNTQFIYRYPGDYNDILLADPEQDDTGLPHYGAMSPVNGQLVLDRAPNAEDAGKVYYYQYDKDLVLDDAADTMPFSDAVFRSMVPVWAQLWRRDRQNNFDDAVYNTNFGTAARLLSQNQPRTSYNPR